MGQQVIPYYNCELWQFVLAVLGIAGFAILIVIVVRGLVDMNNDVKTIHVHTERLKLLADKLEKSRRKGKV